jgi:glycosyltransferase involved in cell wall biosynthesis
MKVVLFIDSLTSGGAQRQLVWLAKLLAEGGDEVVVLTYYPINFFKSDLLGCEGVSVHCLEGWTGQFGRLFSVRRFLAKERPDAVVAFLYIPCFLAELCMLLPGTRYRLVASERNTDIESPSFNGWIRLGAHALAHAVVPNSHAQANFLGRHAPWIRRKLSVITNCLDLELFQPSECVDSRQSAQGRLDIVMIGRYEDQKNGLQLIEGLAKYYTTHGDLPAIRFNWFGNDPNPASGLYDAMQSRISELDLEEHFILNAAERDVLSIYRGADALCLASIYEGCANVVCEAIACGLPVIATRAGDNDRMVEDGINGILIEGFEADGIAFGLERFARLPSSTRDSMRREGRNKAEALLSKEAFAKKWREVLAKK